MWLKSSEKVQKHIQQLPSIFGVSYSLYLHAKQLQQCCEDSHVVEQKNIVSGPVEHIHLGVALIKHSWGKQ